MSGPATATQEWRDVDWPTVEKDVHCLQRRIYRASLKEDVNTVHRLQRLLMSSRSAKLLAVRRVTQDNQGKKTPGSDGVACLEPEERFALVDSLNVDNKPKPVRRIWIPKPGTDEWRPLGIPVMHDRTLQALVKLALEPEWEARFEPNSYGFRPGRSCHDAIAAIFDAVRGKPKYVLDADIAKCFERINHEALLEKLQTFPSMRRLIKAWLQAGVLDGDTLFPTEEGTPQGGVVSPLLANIALHGLETEIRSRYPRTARINGKAEWWQPLVIRYADDFVVLHQDEGVILECKTIAQEWLKGMGLELKPNKTKICHTLHKAAGLCGFDFLGFTVRQHLVGKYRSGKRTNGKLLGFKTIIKPSKGKIKLHWAKLTGVVKSMLGSKQKDLINALNPIIKGWSLYYRTVCSSRIYTTLDSRLTRCLLRWGRRRHPNKSESWLVDKYWNLPGWTFGREKGCGLWKHSDTRMVRHVKVTGTKTLTTEIGCIGLPGKHITLASAIGSP